MEKSRAKWSTVRELLRVDFQSGVFAEFDIRRLFPDYPDMTPVQQYAVEYGIKQILADKNATGADVQKTDMDSIKVFEARFQELCQGIIRQRSIRKTAEQVTADTLTAKMAKAVADGTLSQAQADEVLELARRAGLNI